VAATAFLSACSTMPSVAPTVKVQPATECLTKCPPLEKPLDGSELSVRRWEYQTVEQYGQCRRLHSDCVDWITSK
jgi:hypothetical protein